MQVVVIGTLRFPPENMPKVRPHLRKLIETTRTHDGCLAYDVGEDIFEPGLLRFSELWPNAEVLAAHLGAPHIGVWRAAAAAFGVRNRTFMAYDSTNARSV